MIFEVSSGMLSLQKEVLLPLPVVLISKLKGALMQVKVSGRHMAVTEPIKSYIEEKIRKAEKVIDSDSLEIEIVISHDKNPSIPNQNHVEITGFSKGYRLRVEESAPDMYEAIDLATDRFERQGRKYKTRILARRHARGELSKATLEEVEESFKELEPMGSVVRSKRIEQNPMTEDEAILRMEMLGHDFFMFVLDPTGEKAVVYRRAAGDYGLLRMDD